MLLHLHLLLPSNSLLHVVLLSNCRLNSVPLRLQIALHHALALNPVCVLSDQELGSADDGGTDHGQEPLDLGDRFCGVVGVGTMRVNKVSKAVLVIAAADGVEDLEEE